MSRSLKKGPYIDERLMKKVKKLRVGDKTVIKTWSRDSTITPDMVGFSFGVHNGRDFIAVIVVENMVGHRLGEFSPTRKFVSHGGKIAKEQQRAETVKTPSPATPPAPVTGGKK